MVDCSLNTLYVCLLHTAHRKYILRQRHNGQKLTNNDIFSNYKDIFASWVLAGGDGVFITSHMRVWFIEVGFW